MTVRGFLPALLIAMSSCHAASAQEQTALFKRIHESHEKIRVEVLNDVAVQIKWKTTALPEGEVKAEKDRSFVVQGDSRMMEDGGRVMASNGDYRFRLSDRGGSTEIGYLEGKRTPNAAAEAYERKKGGILLASMKFETYLLSEVLEDEAFVVDSIQEEATNVTIKGKWQEGTNTFEDITIQLDPANLYQVTACRFKLRRPTYGVKIDRTCIYASEPVEGTDVRMLAKIHEDVSDYPLENALPIEKTVHRDIVFSSWERAPDTPEVFRLSGYGLPEPDLNALNGSRSPLRMFASVLVGIAGLLAVVFGRRLFGTLRADD